MADTIQKLQKTGKPTKHSVWEWSGGHSREDPLGLLDNAAKEQEHISTD